MITFSRRRVVLISAAVVVAALIVYGFLPDPRPVQTATVGRAPLQVIVEEEGRTQVAERYVVSSPVPAFVRRMALEVGDLVEAGQPLVHLEAPRATIPDPRTREEMEARVQSARAVLSRTEEEARAAEVASERADAERARVERLREVGAATQQALEQAVADSRQARANLDAARAGVTAARAELNAAQAALRATVSAGERPLQDVLRAPAAGRVLALHVKSEGPVGAGAPLVEIGDTQVMEVMVVVLSQDAVRIHEGTRVLLDQWGGDTTLEAVVRRVEPQGFTEVSSLGVEEQRVTVVARLTSPPDAWAATLGSGYRVLARFVVWEGEDVLQVPAGALFRFDGGWAVFAVERGRAVLKEVTVGQQAGLVTQVLGGLEEGEEVIVHPGNQIADGVRVEARPE